MATAPPKATENAEKAPQAPLKKERGVVKSVLSGDTLIVQEEKPSAQGPPADKIITLSSLQAPKLSRPKDDKGEEPFAWESREFLRKKVIGKKVQYQIDYSAGAGAREYVTVYLAPVGGADPECLNNSIVAEGWAFVFNKDPKKVEALLALEEAAKAAGKGIHSKDKPKPAERNDDPDALFRQLKGKPLNAIVEQVRTGSSVRVTVLPTRHTFQILLSGVQSPGWKKQEGAPPSAEPQPEAYAREAKFFVENHVLQREVQLTIDGVAPGAAGSSDKNLSYSGSIEFLGHDVAEELLQAGLARYIAYSAAARGTDWVAKLKAAEKLAKDNKRRLFANYEAKTESSGEKGVPTEFTGKVVSILNSGAIAVVPDGATNEVQINLSSIKVPRPGFPGDEEADAREKNKDKLLQDRAERVWAAEGKELLRKRLIGQKVRVVFDYTRKAGAAKKEGSGEPLPEKSFYSVYQNDQNLAVILVELGLAWVLSYRQGEERSLDFEVLVMAETKAKTSHKGVHSAPEKVPTRRVNDLCVDNTNNEKRAAQITRTKQFLAGFERAGPQKAIVDYVFSGARCKVSVPKQTAVFMFALSGIRVPKRGETPDSDELSNQALLFSRERLHQCEVTLEVDGVDKGGNFVGNLYYNNKKNFAVSLLENGFASIHYPSAERLKEFTEFEAAEKAAKQKKAGVWKNWDEEEEKKKLEALNAEAAGEVSVGGKPLEVMVTEIVDGSRLYVQIVGAEAAGLDELVSSLTELSVTEGSGMPLITPKVGDLVRGQFTDDDQWYRAKVVEIVSKDSKYKLQYIDYGNSEIVPALRLRPLPSNFHALPPQAQLAGLAFVKPLKEDSDNAKDAKDALKDLASGKKLAATVEYKDGGVIFLTMSDPTEGLNVTQEMVRLGLARLDRRKRHYLKNPFYVTLRADEDKAKQRRAGIWYYGDIPDSDEDEKEAPKKGKPTAPVTTGKDAKAQPVAAPAKPAKKK